MNQLARGRDFAFQVPDDWVERTMIGYSSPPAPDRAVTPNVLVSVGEIAPGEEIGSFVDRQVEDLSHRTVQFTLLLQRPVRLDGANGVEIVFTWSGGEQGTIKQRQVYARRGPNRVLSITHTAREQDFASSDPVFIGMLDQFAWDDTV